MPLVVCFILASLTILETLVCLVLASVSAASVALLSCSIRTVYVALIMAALCYRAGHYIFILWFLLYSSSVFFSSPILSRRILDVYHTSTHGVALVRI